MMKRRAFSILEVLIAIGILAFLGAALVINFYKSHQERKEKDTIDLIESKLRMAAQLAKISDSEVQVLFTQENGKFVVFFDSDLKVSEKMKANLSRKTSLPHVREITLIPNSRNNVVLSYFPSQLQSDEMELSILFDSGNELVVDPAKHLPNVFIDDPQVIEDHFPSEILDDETEET